MHSYQRLGLAAAMLASPLQAGELTEEQFQTIAGEVFRPVMQEYGIPGLAIGVTLEGRHYVFTDGLANRETGQAVDADTLFELGSISKLFTVALAGLAEERGLLSLDSPVSGLAPQLAGSAFDGITLYDLSAHATGGLPLQVPDDIADEAGLMDYLAVWTPDADPATFRSYSNISIGLLGQIVGEQFGGGFEAALEDHLLPPLGLQNTFVTVPQEAMDHYAFGYTRKDGKPVRVGKGVFDAEAYGIKSSVTDMMRFLDAHLGNLDLPEEIAGALANSRTARFDTAYYAQAMVWEGYPWPADPPVVVAGNSPDMGMKPQPMTRREPHLLDGDVFLNKTGSTNGFGAYVAMVPSERIGVVVLANRHYPNPVRAEVTLRLIERVLAEVEEG